MLFNVGNSPAKAKEPSSIFPEDSPHLPAPFFVHSDKFHFSSSCSMASAHSLPVQHIFVVISSSRQISASTFPRVFHAACQISSVERLSGFDKNVLSSSRHLLISLSFLRTMGCGLLCAKISRTIKPRCGSGMVLPASVSAVQFEGFRFAPIFD